MSEKRLNQYRQDIKDRDKKIADLEATVRQLEAKNTLALQPVNNVAPIVWNDCINQVVLPLEAVAIYWSNLEATIAYLRSTVELATMYDTLDTPQTIEAIKNYCTKLSAQLAAIDQPNRALARKRTGQYAEYVDLSYSRTLYNAAVDYVNGVDGAKTRLIDTARSAPNMEVLFSLKDAFKPIKRSNANDNIELYETIEAIRRSENLTIRQACIRYAKNAPGGVSLESESVRRVYKRGRDEKRRLGVGTE